VVALQTHLSPVVDDPDADATRGSVLLENATGQHAGALTKNKQTKGLALSRRQWHRRRGKKTSSNEAATDAFGLHESHPFVKRARQLAEIVGATQNAKNGHTRPTGFTIHF